MGGHSKCSDKYIQEEYESEYNEDEGSNCRYPYVLNTKGLLSKKVARAFIIPISNEVAMQKIKESLKCSGWEILKENKKTWYIRAKKDEYIVTANLTENSNRWILIIEKNDFITKYNL